MRSARQDNRRTGSVAGTLGPLVLGLLVLFCLGLRPVAAQGNSAVYVDIRASDEVSAPVVERWKLYGASHALVIGNDRYRGGWPRLSNAVRDAREVAAMLGARGFEVELLTDVKSDELRGSLRRFLALKGSDPDARLFIWFAGHGHTELGEGYLVPVDAPQPDKPEFLIKALHMGDVGSMVRVARAKHVLAVFDSCFAGTVFSAQRSRPPAAVTRAAVQPVRQFLTSGDADQQVSDDGTFRRLFLAALTGEEAADANRDGYLTGTELSLHLEDRITNLTQGVQTPRAGKLRDPRFDGGDFIFLLPQQAARAQAETPPAAAPAAPSDAVFELEFWDAIKDSRNPSDYQAYLESFPDGRFAPLARRRLQAPDQAAQSDSAARAAEQQAAAQQRAAAEQQARLADPSAPLKSRSEVEAYLKKYASRFRVRLINYNERRSVVTGSGAGIKLKIFSKEIVRLEGDRVFMKIYYQVGRASKAVSGRAVFELQWQGKDLEFVGHRRG